MNALVTRIRSSRQASAAVVAGGIVLFVLVAWVLVVSPKRADASHATAQVEATRTQLVIATRQAATARRTKAIATALQRALPQGTDEPGILDDLQAAAKRSGVIVSTVTPNATATLTNAVSLTVTVEGHYFQIRDFLHRLRTQVKVRNGNKVTAAGRLFDVTGVNITQPTAGSPTLAATLSANAYLFGPAAAPVTPTDATSTTTTETTPAGATAAGSN